LRDTYCEVIPALDIKLHSLIHAMLDKRSSTAHAALRAGAGTATKAVTAVAAAEGTLPAARRRDEADASANEADNGALRASKGAVATRRRRAEEPEMSMDDLPYEMR
jgi:hypothetical protein